MRQVSLGHWPALSFPAAIVAWESARARRDAGGDPALERKLSRNEELAKSLARDVERANVYTVRQLCDDYLDGHIDRNRAKKGAADIRRMFETLLGDFAEYAVTDITRSMAFDLINQYAGKSPVRASRLRSELGAAWDFALDAGKIPESAANWWRLILRGKIRSKGKQVDGKKIGVKKRVLSDDELAELIPWLPNFSLSVSDVLTIYLWTGTRGAEIVAMAGRDVWQENGQWWWTIPKEKTKNARHVNAVDQRVPLFGRALDVVKRRIKTYGDGFLFPGRAGSGHIDQKNVQWHVYSLQPYSKIKLTAKRPRLPVSHWAPHDLRRTVRTLLAKIGCPDAVGESVLGHMLPGVVGTYNRHQYDDEKTVWLGKLSDYLDGLVD